MGHDVRDYVGVVDDVYLCRICLQVLDNAVNTPCGHTFCKACILRSLTNDKKCPLDRKPLKQNDLNAVIALETLLAKLPIKCQYRQNGCQFSSSRSKMSAHESSCESNPDKTSLCPKGCGLMIEQRFLLEHNCYLALKSQLCNVVKSTAAETQLQAVSQSQENKKSRRRRRRRKRKAINITTLEACNASLQETLNRLQKLQPTIAGQNASLPSQVPSCKCISKSHLLDILSQHHKALTSSMRSMFLENVDTQSLRNQEKGLDFVKVLRSPKLLNNTASIHIKPDDSKIQIRSKRAKSWYCITSAHVTLMSVGLTSLSKVKSFDTKTEYTVQLYNPRVTGVLCYTAIDPGNRAGFYCESELIFETPFFLTIECLDNLITKVTLPSPKWQTIQVTVGPYPGIHSVLDSHMHSMNMKASLMEATANLFKTALNDYVAQTADSLRTVC